MSNPRERLIFQPLSKKDRTSKYKNAEFLKSDFNYLHGEGHERGSAHVCEEMRSERLYLSVSDVIKSEGATPYDAAPSVSEERTRKE